MTDFFCSTCYQHKALNQFARKIPTTNNGHRCQCKACAAEAANPPKRPRKARRTPSQERNYVNYLVALNR